MRIPIVFLCLLLGTGCTPYASKFACPNTYNGRCVPVMDAYNAALTGNDGPPAAETPDAKPISVKKEAATGYKAALYQRLEGLLKEPSPPMVAPPQIMRILFLPYKGPENELYMPRYVYFIVDESKWLMGEATATPED